MGAELSAAAAPVFPRRTGPFAVRLATASPEALEPEYNLCHGPELSAQLPYPRTSRATSRTTRRGSAVTQSGRFTEVEPAPLLVNRANPAFHHIRVGNRSPGIGGRAAERRRTRVAPDAGRAVRRDRLARPGADSLGVAVLAGEAERGVGAAVPGPGGGAPQCGPGAPRDGAGLVDQFGGGADEVGGDGEEAAVDLALPVVGGEDDALGPGQGGIAAPVPGSARAGRST